MHKNYTITQYHNANNTFYHDPNNMFCLALYDIYVSVSVLHLLVEVSSGSLRGIPNLYLLTFRCNNSLCSLSYLRIFVLRNNNHCPLCPLPLPTLYNQNLKNSQGSTLLSELLALQKKPEIRGEKMRL